MSRQYSTSRKVFCSITGVAVAHAAVIRLCSSATPCTFVWYIKSFMNPHRNKFKGVKSGDLGGHAMAPFSQSICLETADRERLSLCWNTAEGLCLAARSTLVGFVSLHSSMSRYDAPVTVASLKKNGPITESDVRAHHTFNLRVSRSCSITSCGFSLPQIRKLCLFTLPDMWKVASSGKTCFINALSLSNYNNISSANVWQTGLSFSLNFCIS
jgi:hypothetical protein